MKLPDNNVWLALALSDHSAHAAAHQWLDAQPRDVLFCRATQQSLLRLLTTDAVTAPYGIPALSNRDAWSWYERLAGDKRIAFAEEPNGLEVHWKKLATRRTASPKLWMDAYLAAFAITGNHQLVTFDADFKQFKGLDLLVLTA
jgi:toxin-antitoxin system PIN domain toxin